MYYNIMYIRKSLQDIVVCVCELFLFIFHIINLEDNFVNIEITLSIIDGQVYMNYLDIMIFIYLYS